MNEWTKNRSARLKQFRNWNNKSCEYLHIYLCCQKAAKKNELTEPHILGQVSSFPDYISVLLSDVYYCIIA